MLKVEELTCGYGKMVAVNNISLAVAPGQIVGLIGANGAGKSTTILTLAGLAQAIDGRIELNGQDITHMPVHERVDAGIALVPEGRRVFAELTVSENLLVGGTRLKNRQIKQELQRVYDMFPRLAERRNQMAESLSGGEQQMLAIGRALMAGPELLLIDELSLGLMPLAINECYRVLEGLRKKQLAIILVEQSTERVQQVADHVIVLETGRIVWRGTGDEASRDNTIVEAYLGLT
ncbi:MAG: ABC transporter ATP-binding protein [Gammaproteobacteria bacterium]|nr:ABC transporter ATP-binding protein [Gammaproteobacteria bacterium]MCY4312419.1 ABC transporter ATP-binding protein [Gammaproteobacteria bacterium]